MKDENRIPDFIDQLKGSDKLEVRIGVLGDSSSELVTYAAANEFGTEKIPERSYLRATFVKQSALKRIGTAAAELVKPGVDPRDVLNIVGVVGVGEVQEQIRRGEYQELKPATIKAKGSDKPLIDTGRLIQAISYEVA